MANVHFSPARALAHGASAQIIPIDRTATRVDSEPVYETVSPEILMEGAAAIKLLIARESATEYPNRDAIERASRLVDDLTALPQLDRIAMDREQAVILTAGIAGVSTLVALALQNSSPDLGSISCACWLTADLGALIEGQIERDIHV